MVLSIMFPHFPALGSGGVPPVPPTILMSASFTSKKKSPTVGVSSRKLEQAGGMQDDTAARPESKADYKALSKGRHPHQ